MQIYALNLKVRKMRNHGARLMGMSVSKARDLRASIRSKNLLTKIVSNTIYLPRNVKHLSIQIRGIFEKMSKIIPNIPRSG